VIPPEHKRTVLITGGSSGIGYAAALAFARARHNVAVTARRVDRLAELEAAVAALPEPHGELLAISADVRDAEAVRRAVEQTVAHFGRLDILVANAGVGQRGGIVDSDWEHLETLLRTNIDGVLHSVRAAVPAMRASPPLESGEDKQILVISSVVANMIAPYAATYSASKAFVSSIAGALRYELEVDDIWVTDVRVGRTATEFNEKRLGQAGRSVKAPRLPIMTVEEVADGIVRASRQRRKVVVMRWFDRLIMLGNALLPGFVARRALNQYKLD
jgi:short-subunit dehydrogenase